MPAILFYSEEEFGVSGGRRTIFHLSFENFSFGHWQNASKNDRRRIERQQ
jgi:hypothetical protein